MNTIRRHFPFILLAAIVAVLFFLGIQKEPFRDWDECLYAQYCREMSQQGHYLTNLWNGYIDMQKPPLYSWILIPFVALSSQELWLRLPNVVGAVGILTLVYMFCARYFSRTVGFLAALVLLTGEVFVINSLHLNTDVLFTFFLFAGTWAWFETKHITKIKHQHSYLLPYLAGLLIGVATMMKGLSSLSFLIAIGVVSVVFPAKNSIRQYGKLLVAWALTVVPWHMITFFTYDDRFIKVYLLDNIIKRSRYPIEFHRERIWFYGVLAIKELMPWVFISFAAVIQLGAIIVKHLKGKKKRWKPLYTALTKHQLLIGVMVLIALPLLSITRVQTRVAWYILPIYPFLAIYIAYNLVLVTQYVREKTPLHRLKHSMQVLIVLLSIGLLVDAGQLIVHETRILTPAQDPSFNTQVQRIIQKTPYPTLTYLVPFGERQAREYLPETEQIDMTWVYGGNPCMVYYGQKKTNYIYTTEEFEQILQHKSGMFLVENGDMKYSEGHRVIYHNSEHTLFIVE